jgi:uncharacterized protein YbcI
MIYCHKLAHLWNVLIMNRDRMQAIIDAGFTTSTAYKLEAILGNDESGIARTKQDQEFVNQCRQQLIEKDK